MPISQIVTNSIANGAVAQVDLATGVAGTGPVFLAYQSAAQTGIPNTTFTKITFDTEIFDTNNNFASSRFTPTVAGYYQLNASTVVATLTTSQGLTIALFKNGGQYATGCTANANSALYPQTIVSSIIYCNGTTDYIEAYVYGNFGGAFSTVQGIPNTYFSGALVRAA
jgi:hypothetical protein